MNTLEYIFDTRVDTTKIYVSMNTKFIVRDYINSKNLSPVYLHISGSSKRERLNLDVMVDRKYWDYETQRLDPINSNFTDLNLILDNISSKITNIKTVYRLSEKHLTPFLLKRELIDNMPRVNFCTFFDYALKDEKCNLKPGTYRRHNSVLNKLKGYQPEIIFNEITLNWFNSYRKYLKTKGNIDSTVNSNIIVIKKYLKIAIKSGIRISCDLDDVKGGSTAGNRTSLNPIELKNIYSFYTSDFINPSYKLIVGYFLFSCMTGLRFSDVMKLNRPNDDDEYIDFSAEKTDKDQIISLNLKAKEIIKICPELFIKKFSNEHINRELKLIMGILGIRKKITFHVSRHTFATSFLRVGGSVEKLQLLLGHSNIKQTMIYVHIVAAEANESIYLLDKLF